MTVFYDRFRYHPWATSTVDAKAKMDTAEEQLLGLVTGLADGHGPLAAALAAAQTALQAAQGGGHPNATVRMREPLGGLQDALEAAEQASRELREVRRRWGMASLDLSCWADLETDGG